MSLSGAFAKRDFVLALGVSAYMALLTLVSFQ
jgi:hypothetical protein